MVPCIVVFLEDVGVPLDFGFDGVRGGSMIVVFLEDVGVPLDFGFDGVRDASVDIL